MGRRDLTDRTALVTGAASGIGRELALSLARRGGRVACVDVDLAGATTVAELVGELGGVGVPLACDVADLAQVEAAADEAEAALGPVDLVVNNAGIGAGGRPIGDEPMEVWRRTIDVNLWGVVNGCHVYVPRLRALATAGRRPLGVVNLASAAGFAAAAGMGPYNASKAAVVSLSETLAAELAGTGITVTVVCPTFVRTSIVSSSSDIEAGTKAMAQRAMALTGRSAERIAASILDGHAAGRTYVVPQVEAKAVWAAKRHAPRTYLAASGLLGRVLGVARPRRGDVAHDTPDLTPTTTHQSEEAAR